MQDRRLETIVPPKKKRHVAYDSLMQMRVRDILLVSSLYDSFTFEEDGRLTEMLFSEYLELNLRYAPNIVRVSTANEALEKLRYGSYDMVISMLRVGEMDLADFGTKISELEPDMPVILLTYNTRELTILEDLGKLPGIDRVFAWLGDVRLFLAIIKYIEDRMNVAHDVRAAGVQTIILIEDNVRFYSAYLPLAYTELVQQTQSLLSDGLNRMDKLLRMRARPKLLLATSFEEGEALFEAYQDHVSGVILDASFPRNGKLDPHAGLDFARMVKTRAPDRPVLIQSSDVANEPHAYALGAAFINKKSSELLKNVRHFMHLHMGFGDFVFRLSNGDVIGSANDLQSLSEMLQVIPVESLLHHVTRNDFSTWLMARTEFELARALRPKRADEFSTPEEARQYLLAELDAHRDRSRAGLVADFSSGTFKASSGFVRIGTGSLGGKGRGLAFIHTLLERYNVSHKLPTVNISVPPTAVLATGVFDAFMAKNNLSEFAMGDRSDKEIAAAFLKASFPSSAKHAMRTFLERVHYPLAVRSSSLLEDASYQPFAGVYKTYMLPNNHSDFEERLTQLTNAIKLVYASTFYGDAKAYISSTPNRLEEEKMAVVIQQIVGRKRGNYVYPDIAGVARSYDFYPMEGMKAEDGVASVVLGMGKAVVDGRRCIRFSPTQPRRLYQFSSTADTLNSAQRDFLALNLSEQPTAEDPEDSDGNISTLTLNVAEEDGILNLVGSVYDYQNDTVYDGTSRPGVRLVTMAGVLKSGVFPLAQTITRLLELGSVGFSCQVEIEFAALIREMADEPHEFAFLQIRPVVVDSLIREVDTGRIQKENAICVSTKALGNGIIDRVQDLIYVPMSTFNRSHTVEIAQQIGTMTAKLRAENRPFMLIGPGRWGSADRWLGIPVTWKQISGVRCIVETDMDDIRVTPSQGTHFFQNITSFGIAYLTVNFANEKGVLDCQWLDTIEPEDQTDHVKLLHFSDPLLIVVNGRQGTGVVMKPGEPLVNSNGNGMENAP